MEFFSMQTILRSRRCGIRGLDIPSSQVNIAISNTKNYKDGYTYKLYGCDICHLSN